MSTATVEQARVIHAVPGRMRIHLPGLASGQSWAVAARLRKLPGVERAQVSDTTQNALLHYDTRTTTENALRDQISQVMSTADFAGPSPAERQETSGWRTPQLRITPVPPRSSVIRDRRGNTSRVRIPVRGIDRNPLLARRVTEHLERQPGVVRALASPLTGRVLVEFTEHETDVDSLIANISGLDLPDLPDEDDPAHPADTAPLIQSSTRTAAALAGFGILAARRITSTGDLIVSRNAATQTANVISIMRGFPVIRNGARQLLGRNVADIAFTVPNLVALALSDNPLGLTVTGLESLRLLTEVIGRRRAWQRLESRAANLSEAQPGKIIHLETGERVPLDADIVEGTGTALDRNGLPVAVTPGAHVEAGAKLFGGPFALRLKAGKAFTTSSRPAPLKASLYDQYVQSASLLSLGFATLTGIFTRSLARMVQALVLVSPRTAIIGMEAANLDATARIARAGGIVIGSRAEREIRRPDVLLLDGARLLVDSYEIASALPLSEGADTAELVARAAAVARAAGSPWGNAFRASPAEPATNGVFDGTVASADAGGERYAISPVVDWQHIPAAVRLQQGTHLLLELRGDRQGRLAVFLLRPKLARGATDLAQTCARLGVKVGILADSESLVAREIAHRARMPVIARGAVDAIRVLQENGAYIAFASDSAHAGEAFAACDLAIGVIEPRSQLPARADVLAPDLTALAAILDTGARRDASVRDSVGFSTISNGIGVAWGIQGIGINIATRGIYGTALATLADGWLRMRGGERPPSALEGIVEPHPERWGRLDIPEVLRTLHSSENGLTSAQAEQRRQITMPKSRRNMFLPALLEQMKSPLTVIIGGSAIASLVLGSAGNAAIIGVTVVGNALVAAWQEHRVGRATEALIHMGRARARVLRDGEPVTLAAGDLVPGDILLLTAGDTITADARVIQAQNLEVDESSLTGESLSVPKMADGGTDGGRVVLEGSGITMGSGRAVVVAVGRQTRMGATAAALAGGEMQQSAIGMRLSRMVWQTLPFAAVAGTIVSASGLLRGGAPLTELMLGATIVITALPEGLPVLAQIGEAGVAHRLAMHNALVRRLSAVEALGRVDVACTDKTGTLTEGHLALTLVANATEETTLPDELSSDLHNVLLVAALASPHPDDPASMAHPTDMAVIRGAQEAGLNGRLYAHRDAELPFDPVRAYAAALVQGRLCVKGAPETLITRCSSIYSDGETRPLEAEDRQRLIEQGQHLAARGLRILLAAEGSPDMPIDDLRDLVALGFIGISDPLRPNARDAVEKCREAGIRVIMLTGDHPATARAIAREAGLLDGSGGVLTGAEIAELHNGELDQRLEHASVIARATPLDKLRIIESLQRHHHTVAMTGDGVNDAPALRLADVGVAMGKGGTEVARQTADVVLVDDDFSTLVGALVEGRSYWHNVRRALGLLVGGNLGELGMLAGASVIGLASPVSARQILGVNMITDILPGIAVALQQPENHDLAALSREGESALGAPLRNDIMRRASITALPSLAATLAAWTVGGPAQASAVAYSSMVTTQLIQTLEAGHTDEGWNGPMVSAVVGSGGILAATLAVPTLRNFFGLAIPSPFGWAVTVGATGASFALSRLFSSGVRVRPAQVRPRLPLLPAPAR